MGTGTGAYPAVGVAGRSVPEPVPILSHPVADTRGRPAPRRGRAGLVIATCLVTALAACDRAPAPPAGKATGRSGPSQPQAAEAPAPARPHSFVHAGPMPTLFREAPSLAKLVAAGELPPVAERLPEQPLVIAPVARIGRYGGTWRRAFTGPADRQNIDRIQHDHVIYYDLDFKLVPHIAASWEVQDDGRVFIFRLRKGMKWSDGHPFTADDFVFAYEDMQANAELNPTPPTWMRAGDDYGVVTRDDDHTVRYTFARPYHAFLEIYAGLVAAGQSARGWMGRAPYAPRHYLEQFHPRYRDRAQLDAVVAEAGLDSWVQLIKQRGSMHENPQLPVVGPWKTVQPITSQRFVLERNPYYWAVDPEGHQLPYIDRIAMQLMENLEVLNLKALAGEIDMQHRHIQLAKYPVLKKGAARGGYRLHLWPNMGGSEAIVFVNQTYDEDAEVMRWLRNHDFRIALSIGIDRDEINEAIFLGTGTPRAFVAPPGTPYYPGPEYESMHVARDLEKANAILDRIGLEQRDGEGARLRTDGKGPLILKLAAVNAAFLDYPGVAELLTRHWRQIGLRIDVSLEERSLFTQRNLSNQHQMLLWGGGGSEGIWYYPLFTIPLAEPFFAPQVGLWYRSGGASGIEPTGPMKRLLDLYELGLGVPRAQRIAYGQEVFRIHAEQLYTIGTVGLSPAFNGVVVVKNNFVNVPNVAPNSAPLQNPGIARPEQFFFAGGG